MNKAVNALVLYYLYMRLEHNSITVNQFIFACSSAISALSHFMKALLAILTFVVVRVNLAQGNAMA